MGRVTKWALRLTCVAVAGAVTLALVSTIEGRRAAERLRAAADARAIEIARHRQEQRSRAPEPAVTAPPAASATPAAGTSATPPAGASAASAAAVARPYWTGFRGPARDGHYRERPIRTEWTGPMTPLWKQPVGGGHASFAIAGGHAFTIEQRGGDEVVAAYDVATGREIWTTAWPASFSAVYGGLGPRATPAWHDGRVFALGATGELRALDASSGRTVWRTNILEDAGAGNAQWGMAASPLVVRDRVVVMPGGSGGQSVVAYEAATGRRAWSALDDDAGYSSPMLARIAGVDQILVFTASRLASLAPEDGRLLWAFAWKTQGDANASQPLPIGDDRVFISTGYGMGAVLLEVTANGERFDVREVWRTNRMKNQFTSSLHHEGFIYGLDESILACVDASTGELKWKGGRYGYGQVMLADGHLIVLTEEGELALVRATPERHVELARFPVLDGSTWNHPAMGDGYLLIRNINEMAAFDLRRD
jgi:outer membrane protein assembly factor BamB